MGSKNGVEGREVQFNAEISRRVEKLRVEQRVRRCDMARALGVSQALLRAYETGLTRWPVFRVRLVAQYFDVSVEQLIPRMKTYVNETRTQENLFVV
jgi:transcriptional regulator with XRE-family HTH domain